VEDMGREWPEEIYKSDVIEELIVKEWEKYGF